MRRRMMLPVLASLIALLAAACGGGGGDGGGNTGGSGQGEAQLANLNGQTVSVAAQWSGTEQERFQQVLDLFKQKTGATVQYTPTGQDTGAFLSGRIAGGNPPDVALLPNPGLLNDYAGQGALKQVDSATDQAVTANYAPIWKELGSVDGKLYGVWFKAANKSTVWYNVQALENAGVQPPQTWDEFKQAADTIAASGTPAIAVGGSDAWPLTDWFENIYLRTAGPEKYDQLARHEIPWTDDSVKQALTTMAEVLTEQNLAGGVRGALSTDFPGSVTQVFSDPPKAAIVYEGDFVAGVITGETEARLGEQADFFNFPSINNSQPAVVGGGDVAVLLKDSPGGKELMKFLASGEAGEVWAKLGGFTSSNKQVDLSVYPDDITRRSAEALTTSQDFRFDLSDLVPAAFGGTPGRGLFKQFQDFLRNPQDVDGITKQMEEAAAAADK
jgi:hypothetical protein